MLFLPDTQHTYLIDMVMSCKYDDTNPFYGGTKQYASPELLNQIPIIDWRHSDIWSLGIVIYIIIFDIFPWVEADIIKCSIYNKYKQNPEAYWNEHSDLDPKIKKLLSGCLVVDPIKRLNISQLIDILNEK
jgi:serine/threonine protein kinase